MTPEPQPPNLPARLDVLADGMRQFPALCATPDEVALVREAAGRIRELEAENARLRSIIDEACEPPFMDAQQWADWNMAAMRDALEGPDPEAAR